MKNFYRHSNNETFKKNIEQIYIIKAICNAMKLYKSREKSYNSSR